MLQLTDISVSYGMIAALKGVNLRVEQGEIVALIKPQFEAARHEHKKGVVRKAATHEAILKRVIMGLVNEGWTVRGLCYSPIKGPAGNIEFLLHFGVGGHEGEPVPPCGVEDLVAVVVREAHENLDNNV